MNKPHLEARAELGVEDNAEARTEPSEEESIVRAFMHGPDESDICLLAALAIASGAGKTPLATLPSLPLLGNHCYQTYQNSLIGKA